MKVLRARNEQIRQLRYHTQQANLAYAQYFHWLYMSPTCRPQPANRHQQKAAALAATSGQQAVASNQQQAGHRHQAAASRPKQPTVCRQQPAGRSQQPKWAPKWMLRSHHNAFTNCRPSCLWQALAPPVGQGSISCCSLQETTSNLLFYW